MPEPESAAMPDISILVCTRPGSDLLPQCMESLRGVLGEARGEIVTACDGGDAALGERCREVLGPAAGWGWKWLDLERGGPAAARNRALHECTRELILFLNDDVRFPPGLLGAHLRAHAAQPGHAVMGNTRWAPEAVRSEFMHWVAHHDSFYYLIADAADAGWEYFHTMNLSIHRKWFDAGARFDESFPEPAFEDTELAYRLAGEGLRIALAYDAVLYHVHPFTEEQYVEKVRMRGRAARRLLALHPELTKRILGDFELPEAPAGGAPGRWLRRLLGKDAEAAVPWQRRLAEAFLQGYRSG